MNITKAMATAGIGAAVVAGSMLAVTAASAHSGGLTEEQSAERTSALAERFDLDASEVETYFEEQRAERQVEREAERAEHVAGLVEAGTLTQAQADELTVLKDEAKAAADTLRESGAEHDEIKALWEESRTAMQAWADAQGINLDDIRPEGNEGRGGRGHGGHRGGHRGGAATTVES